MAVGIASKPIASLGIQNVGVYQQNRFEELVLALKEALGPSSGLTCDDIDINFLTRLMQDYDGSDQAWAKYAFGDRSRGYTRNLVDEGNGKSNLVRSWSTSSSTIHLTDDLYSLYLSGHLERAVLSTIMVMPIA